MKKIDGGKWKKGLLRHHYHYHHHHHGSRSFLLLVMGVLTYLGRQHHQQHLQQGSIQSETSSVFFTFPVVQGFLPTVQLLSLSLPKSTRTSSSTSSSSFPTRIDQDDDESLSSSSSSSSSSSPLERELNELQERYTWIEALEERNKAQLDSFIDEEHQWESLDIEERSLLESKPKIEARMELLTEQLIQLWMGQKSMEG